MTKPIFNLSYLMIFCFCNILAISCFGQAINKSYFYLTGNNYYVLSEKSLYGSPTQTFNSLFIWKKNEVIRMIFKYEGKTAKNKVRASHHLYSLNEFLGSVGTQNLFYKKTNAVNGNSNYYDVFRLFGQKSEIAEFQYSPLAYTTKLKVLINDWNRKHNPMADKLGSVHTSEGEHEVLEKNARRKTEFHNNFPLAFSLPGSDTIYFAKVYYLNIYQLEAIDDTDKAPKLKRFELFSTVDFMDKSFYDYDFTDENRHQIAQPKNIEPLPYIFQGEFSLDTNRLFGQLARYKQTPYNKYRDLQEAADVIKNPYSYLKEIKYHRIPGSNKFYSDTIYPKPVQTKKITIDDCNGLSEYCKACYDSIYSGAQRIAKHCPIVMGPYDQKWSYAFIKPDKVFFNVENLIRNVHGYNYDDEYLRRIWNWQLMSPGIGYWLLNDQEFESKYKPSAVVYYINGVKIN